ncbi:MAG: hypothetical protein J0I12_33140 [Candidatus Eremiobacteraeota bacterium]|nr:hypothetical protein [Candidatus Eremiobacteraeota bacterium]
MRKTLLALTLVAASCLPLAAEPVFVRNKPFKGPSSGSGAALMVGLKEIAEALELTVVEKNGGFLVNTEEGEPKDGEVLVGGKPVASAPGDAGVTVNLKEFVEAAGMVYRPNKSMGTIDVSKGSAAGSKSTAGAALGAPGVAVVVQQNAGSYVNVRSLAVRGSFTVVLLYQDGYKDAGYKSMFSKVDGFLKRSDVAVYKVKKGFPGSPMFESLPKESQGGNPQLLIFDKSGVLKRAYNGHSITEAIPNGVDGLSDFIPMPWSQR